MAANLSVNLNAVAMLRNRRDLPWPDIEHVARLALAAGAHGLTVHPRPDQRHTRDSDLPILRALIDDEFPKAEFNIEGYPTSEFVQLVLANQPDQVTLVPDDPAQATSDHGWDIEKHAELLGPVISELKSAGCRVSLFVDPDTSENALGIAAKLGTDRVELYTEPYAASVITNQQPQQQIDRLAQTARHAKALGLGVNAGHDLTVANLPAIAKAIPFLDEVSIGHGLTADCLEYGMAGAVKRFLSVLV